MFNGISPTQLADILAAVEPAHLKGLALFRRRQPRHGRWFPADVSPRTLAEAAGQMMGYMQDCERAMKQLSQLPPVPLGPQKVLVSSLEEFPL